MLLNEDLPTLLLNEDLPTLLLNEDLPTLCYLMRTCPLYVSPNTNQDEIKYIDVDGTRSTQGVRGHARTILVKKPVR
jgi:hypothetical protein